MSDLLVVFGATGNQGGSVVNAVFNDPALSKQYRVRAVTRDASSDSAKAIKAKYPSLEVVSADLDDPSSIPAALEGANTLFAFTASILGPNGKEREIQQGKALIDSAIAAGVSFIIFSTLPHVMSISGGKYTKVAGFDAKAEIEQYLKSKTASQQVKTAFYAAGSFMQNWHTMMKPRPDPSGNDPETFVVARHVSPSTKLPLVEISADTGKFVAAILADPDKFVGKTICGATRLYSLDEIAEIIGRKTGKNVKYVQISAEEFKKNLPPWADVLLEMMLYQQDFGYYGGETEEKVKWSVENARGQVTTFEEYLDKYPLVL